MSHQKVATLNSVLEGQVKINGEHVDQDHLITFENNGEKIELDSTYKTKVLVLSGQPLNEPIAHYGPFVMNTQKEIADAIDDFNSGKFGEI